jgi:hypothetical protein
VTGADTARPAHDRAAYERRFRRAGLPLFIEDRSATRDVFTRAVPFFGLVFVGEMLTATRFSWTWWQNLLATLGALAVLIVAFGLLNLARRRRFFALPRHFGVFELGLFVLVPALLPVIFNGRFGKAGLTAGSNILLVGAAYVVIAFGLPAIAAWAARRMAGQLATSLRLLTKALPLLLIFSLTLFMSTEMWQIFARMGTVRVVAISALFAAIALVFMGVRLPAEVRLLEGEAGGGGPPLSGRERFNVGLVLLGGEVLQALVVSVGVGVFFVVFGALAIDAHLLRADWGIGVVHQVGPAIPFLVEHHVVISRELLNVSGAMAAFTGLYFAIAMLTDATYRGEFLDEVTGEMRETFRLRGEYRALARP